MVVAINVRGHTVTVDEQDAHLLAERSWHITRNRNTDYVRSVKARKTVYLHRIIAGATTGEMVDHRDGNGLNNCRENLRIVTNSQNCQNRHNPWGSSRFKGVYWRADKSRWIVTIAKDGKRVNLGSFTSEEEAARRYDTAAREIFGEFASTNFPHA